MLVSHKNCLHVQFLFLTGFNETLESQVRQVGDEVFGILNNLNNLTAGELMVFKDTHVSNM